MKHIFLTLQAVLLAAFVGAQTFTGATFFTGTNTNYISDAVTDASGNIYCTGYFYGSIDLGLMTITSESGNNKAFVMKTDPTGNPIWVVPMGNTSVNAMAIERTADGSIYVGGSFRSKLFIGNDSLVSASTNNAFIAKFSSAGVLLWMTHFPGKAGDNLYNRMNIFDLAKDQSGNIYYTGFFTTEISFDVTTLTAFGTTDVFYGKIGPTGNSIWFRKCGGTYGGGCGLPNNDSGNSIAVDGSGNVYLAGHFAFNFTIGTLTAPGASDIEAFIAKCDNSGNPLWVHSVTGPGVQTATHVAADPWGNAILAVRFQLHCFVDGDTLHSHTLTGSPYDFVLIKYNPSGNILWHRQEGFTAGGDYPEAMLCDPLGNIYVCGKFTGSTQIGDTTLTSTPSWADRIFLASYSPSGSPHFVIQCGGEKNFPHAMALTQTNQIVLAGSADIGSTAGIQFGPFTCPGSYGHYPYIVTMNNHSSGTGQKHGTDKNIDIYPNPSQGVVFIRAEEPIQEIHIFNIQGACMHSRSSDSRSIDLHVPLKPGLYIMKVTAGGLTSSHPLMIGR
jgi:hypothetical protein